MILGGPIVLALALAAPALAWPRPAAAQQYDVADLGTLGGGDGSNANAINAAGQVAGEAFTPDGTNHAFRWQAGAGMTDLGVLPGDTRSTAQALNAAGQVVGFSYSIGTGVFHAFLWSDGPGMIPLGTLGGRTSFARAINNFGLVVGEAETADRRLHPFLWEAEMGMIDLSDLGAPFSNLNGINDAGQMVGAGPSADSTFPPEIHAFLWVAGAVATDLGTLPGGRGSVAYAINAGGEVVGEAYTEDYKRHAFSWQAGAGMLDLGILPGGDESSALALNAAGQVVGWSLTAPAPVYAPHAFLDNGSAMIDLNDRIPPGSGWTLQVARGINDAGQIVGYGLINGETHAFLLTPKANPAASARPALSSGPDPRQSPPSPREPRSPLRPRPRR